MTAPQNPSSTTAHPRLLRRKEVLSRVGLSKSTLYEQVAAGEFPAPIPISRQSVAWLSSEVDAWIQQRVDERNRRRQAVPPVMRF